MLLLQDAARPQASGHGVAAVDTHLLALEVFRRADASLGIDQDGAVMKGADQEDRHGGEPLSLRARTDIGGDRHLADVVFEAAHPAAGGVDEGPDLLKIEALAPPARRPAPL